MKIKKKMKSVASILVAGVVLGACGGSGQSASDSTAASGRVKNVAITSVPAATTDPWSKSCAEGGGCRLGDTGPGGGVVFYSGKTAVNKLDGVSDGGTYLEFLPTDTYMVWGCENTLVSATTASWTSTSPDGLLNTFGKGAANSKAIVDACPPETAADVALEGTYNGKSDWFLPSIGELNQLCWVMQKKVPTTTEPCVFDTAPTGNAFFEKVLKKSEWLSSSDQRHDRAWVLDLVDPATNSGKVRSAIPSDVKHTTENYLGVVRAFGTYAGEPPVTTSTLPPTCENGGVCKIGDKGPGGGVVFYVGSSKVNSYGAKYPGGKYMEYLDPSPGKTYKFKCVMHIHDLKSGIGAGAENTARYRDKCKDADSPIVLASDATNGGKSDWFIPSMQELNQICRYSRAQTLGSGENGSTLQCNGKAAIVKPGTSLNVAQWSSEQYSERSMIVRSFGDGTTVYRDKMKYSYNYFLVRAFG